MYPLTITKNTLLKKILRSELYHPENYQMLVDLKYLAKELEGQRNIKDELYAWKKELLAGKEFAEWVKERKISYLNDTISGVKESLEQYTPIIKNCEGQVYQWFGDFIRDEFVKPLVRKYEKTKNALAYWENTEKNYNEITDYDIEMAKQVECENFVQIKRNDGDRRWALCIFHNEKTPSFCIYHKKNRFHCFGCNSSGDSIDLAMKLNNLTFIEAVRFLIGK